MKTQTTFIIVPENEPRAQLPVVISEFGMLSFLAVPDVTFFMVDCPDHSLKMLSFGGVRLDPF